MNFRHPRIARLLALLAVTASALVGLVVNASPASAAVAGAKEPTTTLTLTAYRSSGVGTQSVITCTIDIGNPTLVTFAGISQVEVTGFTNCTAPVSSIRHTTTLYYIYQGIPLFADSRTGFGTKNVTTVPYYPSCLAGPWYGVADAFVVFPAGYTPPSGRIGKTSGVSTITC